jgi:hypothetical protein
MDTLILREQETKRIAEVYYKNVDNCVDRLSQRFENEQSKLLKECKADGDIFWKLVKKAKNVIAENSQEGVALVGNVKKNTRRREEKHRAELASLQTLSGKLGITIS